MYYGNLRQKRQCKHWKNKKTQAFTSELWHSSVLFLVGLAKSNFQFLKVIIFQINAYQS